MLDNDTLTDAFQTNSIDLRHEYGNQAVKRVNDMYAMPKVWEQMVGIWREAGLK